MIVFHKLRYRNLLASGNAPIEIILDKHPTTLVIGDMGCGKSTMLDAITFALYGKPFREINKDQLINSINGKQCLVELWFSIGPKQYQVSRGIKPAIFEIRIDGVILEQVASAKDHQKTLEKTILHMDLKSFSQVVVLSVADYVPFMKLDTPTRRAVTDDILDVAVFSTMSTVLKEKISALKEKIRTIDNGIDVHRQKIEIQKGYVATLCADQASKKVEISEQIEASNKKIEAYEQELVKLNAKIAELESTIADADTVSGKRAKYAPMTTQLANRYAQTKKKIDFYTDTQTCPTCNQNIDDETRKTHIDTNTTKVAELDVAMGKLKTTLTTIQAREAEIAGVRQTIQEVSRKIQSVNSSIIAEQSYIRKLNAELISIDKNVGNIDAETAKIKSLTEASMNLVRQKSELSETKQYYDVSTMLLKDTGVKSKIIEKYVPIINKLINQYLGVMDLWVNFTIDENFNETIKSRYRDTFTYSSFSEGEKQRIDLAILFTWRTIAKMKNSISCNLLLIDEIADKSLDLGGLDNFVSLLGTLGAGTNVFIISHKQELHDKFDDTIRFEKDGNFSRIQA